MFAAHRVGTPSTLAGLDAGCTLLQTVNFQTQAEALVKLPLRQGPSFTATARGDLRLRPRGKAVTLANKPHLQGSSRMTQHPASAAPAPTVPMSGVHANPCSMGLLLGQHRREKHALQTAVWGVGMDVIIGTVCRLPAI